MIAQYLESHRVLMLLLPFPEQHETTATVNHCIDFDVNSSASCAQADNAAIAIALVSTALCVHLLQYCAARAIEAKPTNVIHQSSASVEKNRGAHSRSFRPISHATTVVSTPTTK